MFPVELVVKMPKSNALDIEVEIWFPGSRVLFFPLKDFMPHI
jgi:hypothetical protein